MDQKRILEIIKKQKKEQAKKYYICMNQIIKNRKNLNGENKCSKYFLEKKIN